MCYGNKILSNDDICQLQSPACEGQGDVDIRRLKLLLNMSLTRTEIAEQLQISKPTLNKIFEEK